MGPFLCLVTTASLGYSRGILLRGLFCVGFELYLGSGRLGVMRCSSLV